MKIGELARRAGVRTSTVRYYERIGLLPQAPRTSGQRQYEPQMLERLTVIELCQQAGFTLEEIAMLLRGMTPGNSLSQAWKSMAHRKLEELDGIIAQVTTMRQLLTEGLNCGCLGAPDCALTTRIQAERAQKGVKKLQGALHRKKDKLAPASPDSRPGHRKTNRDVW